MHDANEQVNRFAALPFISIVGRLISYQMGGGGGQDEMTIYLERLLFQKHIK
jgi:hypothetical protein